MAKTSAFDHQAADYDQWFDEHLYVYESELEAIKRLLPEHGLGLEVGVGTGRFAAALGIEIGLEPSRSMREIARSRGIETVEGIAEALPFPDGHFDYVLFVTTLCFLDSPEQAFKEAFRVLNPGGVVLVGMIDRNSPLGREYENRKKDRSFYEEAVFYSVNEVEAGLKDAGFGGFRFVETLFHPLAENVKKESANDGYGQGSFVVIKATK